MARLACNIAPEWAGVLSIWQAGDVAAKSMQLMRLQKTEVNGLCQIWRLLWNGTQHLDHLPDNI